MNPPLNAMPGRTGWAVLGLLLNTLVWGLSWLPLRWLEGLGLHALWSSALFYLVSMVVLSLWHRGALAAVLRHPALWLLALASGSTNAAFNVAVTLSDVLRVVLLFYLSPLWTVFLARLLLGEPLTPMAAVRVLMGLAGAAVVLWPEGGGWPWPRSTGEVLGLLGGVCFALNNVLLRRLSRHTEGSRAMAMFVGGVVVPAGMAIVLSAQGIVPGLPAPAATWMLGGAAVALAFLVANLGLQYGAARLPANVTSVVMLAEIVIAAISAVALGAGVITGPLVAGASLILAAALLAAWKP